MQGNWISTTLHTLQNQLRLMLDLSIFDIDDVNFPSCMKYATNTIIGVETTLSKKKLKHFAVDPRFINEVENQYGHAIDLSDMPDEIKLSGKLIELVDPYRDGELGSPLLYDCATIAWNECLQEDYDTKTNYVLNNMMLNYTNYRQMIDALKRRKRLLFPDELRGIKRVAIIDKGNGNTSINVVSDTNLELMFKVMMENLDTLGKDG